MRRLGEQKQASHLGDNGEEKILLTKRPNEVSPVMRMIKTPTIILEVNGVQLSAFVDTGSAATLMKQSVSRQLGLEGRIKNCVRRLYGVSNTPLKLLGQVNVNISVTGDRCLEHNVIVVPDCYLTSDILMGSDLIGRAKFVWVGQREDLYWGGRHYRVCSVQGKTVNRIRWKKAENFEPKAARVEDKSIHITENIAVPPGQVTSIRISHKTFRPG